MEMYEDTSCNLNSVVMRAVVDGQFVLLQRQTETNDTCLLISVGWTVGGMSLSMAHSVITGNENECQALCLISYDHYICPQEVLTNT